MIFPSSAYRLLYEHTKVIHGDISLHSLKYRKADGEIYGVLIDYDLPLFFKNSKQGPSTKQQMGTMSYMALDLILPTLTKRLYRHDLESLFYVIVVLVTRYDGGEEIEDPPFQDWFEPEPEWLRIVKFEPTPKWLKSVKYSFLRELPAQPTSTFENLGYFLLRMRIMFSDGYLAQHKHKISVRLTRMDKNPKTTSVDQAILDSEFNDETLGGNVDFDKFQTLLNNIKPPMGPTLHG
jgi:hypothetical protein